MRSAKSEQEINIQEPQRRVSRPSAWGRMLVTSALLLGLSGCATADVKKPTVQQKAETKIEQTVKKAAQKEEPHCSKASKNVTKNGVTRTFTAETCDNWNYITKYFDDHQFKVNSPIPIREDFHGEFIKREIILGDAPACSNWIVAGVSAKTFRVYLVTDVVSKVDSGKIIAYVVDTGVIADGTNISLIQSDSCNWDAKFTDKDSSVIMQITKEGDLLLNGKIRN
ncbi:Uncharacterised protein [uncultured archaeon]|nr:Uncharacterised protein [uncultured archaeon]